MSGRPNMQDIRKGMTVYMADGQALGTIEQMQGTTLMVKGQSIPQTAIARVTREGVYLDGSYASGRAASQEEGAMRVAVAEERLSVGKREVEQGEVEIRKTVTEEQQTVGVTLQHEQVTVQERDTADRPLRAGEAAFEEGVITVAVRGEEAVVAKEAVVTGEVVIGKERVAEERQISDTVRREHVEVAENYRQTRTSADVVPATDRTVETNTTRTTGTTGTTKATGTKGGDNWEELREDIRETGERTRN